MIVRQFISCLLAAGLFAVATAADAYGKPRPPNIIFILADDLGWSELGCYGNRFNETPHLDRLAAQGMRFTQAYAAAPVCSPTRAALLTGQYPVRVGITNYLDRNDANFLSPDYLTLNERLQAAGYVSGLIGKWHLTGDYGLRRGEPARHGFDEIICSERAYIAGGAYFHPYFFMTNVAARLEDEYLTDRLNLEAVEFIERHKERPFFLYLSHYSVHTRLAGKPALVAKYAAKPDAGSNTNRPQLAAMLESIDDGVGRIVAKLDELNLTGNTILVFSSDNGGESRVTSNAPLRGGKSQLYEGGIRVPCVVRWPSKIKPGSTCDNPIITHDFYPTLLQAAGLKPDPNQVCDGRSLLPLFEGGRTLRRDGLYWHYPLVKPHFLDGRSAGAIRKGDYKLIEFFETGRVELYDLSKDLSEQHDLAPAMPRKAKQLREQLVRWRTQFGRPAPGKGRLAGPPEPEQRR